MPKIVFIGAGSGFGAQSVVDILSFPELRDCELVLVDVNPHHLEPVAEFARQVVAHYDAPAKVRTVGEWRGGVLDGADYVMTSFAQGGPAYNGVPYHHEIAIPAKYGIPQCVADTAGIGGVVRTMRTAPELLAIGKDMEARCPGAYLFNYVNPMSMLTRTLALACPQVHMLGLCHNIQYGIRDLARWLGVTHKDLRYTAAGVNHMDWFLRLEYLDGRNAYPDLLKAIENPEIYRQRGVQFELLREFGYFTTESARHCSEYLPYYLPRPETWEKLGIKPRETKAEVDGTAPRWGQDSDLRQQLDGRKPMRLARTFEYGMHIMHALETDAVYRMHLNVINQGAITNFPDDYCVEVRCTVDRTGVHPEQVGRLPLQLAALCRGLADMQTLASDAVLEKDLQKALWACQIDPATAACAPPDKIRACFNELLAAERPWLEEFWGSNLSV
ncbi:MAG: alpha-glucosidase/alpha-galactosidase [Lentisphaeria bacterium]|jgi:alpha-galactosidase|nr:alpha-glucosidase/alpha-galactosidase [Lentisphaeria bacterium]